MNAHRCDLCGELYAENSEIRIKSLAGIYYTLLRRNDGAVIDICSSCRLKLQDVFDTIGNDWELGRRKRH